MAEVVWTEPAVSDLIAIADYIAVDSPTAAAALVTRVVAHVGQLAAHPDSGHRPPELGRSRYQQIVEPPCRVISWREGALVLILHVVRGERRLRRTNLRRSRLG